MSRKRPSSSPSPGGRARKVNEALKEILAEGIQGLADPRLGMVTITDVRTSTDLRTAEIFYTVLPDEPETRAGTAAALESATPLLRRTAAGQLRLRQHPELRFTPDPIPEQGRRLEQLLADDRREGADGDASGG